MKHLILNADDFAFNAAVSRGIVALAQEGRLTATSAMTLSPRWAQDAPALAEVRDQIDVGLHLDWTSAFARAAGHGKNLPKAMLKAVLGGFNQVQAKAVIERQLDAFEQVWKAAPSHIDGHQHVQQFKGIREALVAVMVSRYGNSSQPKVPYVRVSQTPETAAYSVNLKTKVIAGLGANAIKKIAIKAYITPSTGLFGIYNFENEVANDKNSYASLMQHWLAQAPADSIIMCHPANGKSEPGDAADDIAIARQREFGYFMSDAFLQDINTAQVSLFPMKSPKSTE